MITHNIITNSGTVSDRERLYSTTISSSDYQRTFNTMRFSVQAINDVFHENHEPGKWNPFSVFYRKTQVKCKRFVQLSPISPDKFIIPLQNAIKGQIRFLCHEILFRHIEDRPSLTVKDATHLLGLYLIEFDDNWELSLEGYTADDIGDEWQKSSRKWWEQHHETWFDFWSESGVFRVSKTGDFEFGERRAWAGNLSAGHAFKIGDLRVENSEVIQKSFEHLETFPWVLHLHGTNALKEIIENTYFQLLEVSP